MKKLFLILISFIFISCGAEYGMTGYNIREGWVMSKYIVTENNNEIYIVNLESYNGKRHYSVQTNHKTWQLTNIGQYIVLKRYN